MSDNPSGPDLNFSVAEEGYSYDPYFWNSNLDNTGDRLIYFDPDSPWSSFAPDTPPSIGILTPSMPSAPPGSDLGFGGYHLEENEQCRLPVHHTADDMSLDPSPSNMDQYQATYDTEAQDSGAYINTEASSYSHFHGVGPSGPFPVPHPYSTYSFEQQIETYQGSNLPLVGDGQDFNQYGSVAVAGGHPPPGYTPSHA
ncbi:hypothetical protein B0T20DRAFT_146262 [Sordaria brevicollis]|uniref:Uncharacterized protein n=1 Tax=Sordaria brevicollis TaxID=83679 RepID=A0AAE0UDS0_SORBR|nr:hypothetical protein B0T20DRAFT_146262 [Sordaria brevicollis]